MRKAKQDLLKRVWLILKKNSEMTVICGHQRESRTPHTAACIPTASPTSRMSFSTASRVMGTMPTMVGRDPGLGGTNR